MEPKDREAILEGMVSTPIKVLVLVVVAAVPCGACDVVASKVNGDGMSPSVGPGAPEAVVVLSLGAIATTGVEEVIRS